MRTVSLPLEVPAGGTRSPRLLSVLGDARLVELVRRGNEAAFEVLYDRHHRGLLSFCRHMLGSRQEAEDAVQHTFLSAYNALLRDDEPIQAKPWLYTIARNRCLSVIRARREQPGEVAEPSTAGLSEQVSERADLRELLHDLGDLPERRRAALVLSELGGLSHPDIADVLGCQVAQVKSLVFQARSALMQQRRARELSCRDVREQISTAAGRHLRGDHRRHLRVCSGCAEFRDEVRRQNRALAAVLPVVPTLGLKDNVLAATGISGGGGGGGIAGGLLSQGEAAKLLAAGALATGAAVGLGLFADAGGDSPASAAMGPPAPDPKHAVKRGDAAAHRSPLVDALAAARSQKRASQRDRRSNGREGDGHGRHGADGPRGRSGTERGAAPGRDGRGESGGTPTGRSGPTGGSGPTAGSRGPKKPKRPKAGRPSTPRGFTPTPGESNGDAAREFARGRGRGEKTGLPGPASPPNP